MSGDGLLGKAVCREATFGDLTGYLGGGTQDLVARGIAEGHDERDALTGSRRLDTLTEGLLSGLG